MAYRFYLCGERLPVEPEKLTLKIKNKNTTLNLLDGKTIGILKSPGLTEISLSVTLPMFSSGKKPTHYLALFERYKVKKKPTQFIVTRTSPDGKPLFDTNLKVSIEDYTISEAAKKGFDPVVDLSLKQYLDYGTQIVQVETVTENGQTKKVVKVEKERETHAAPSAKSYTVKGGDSLWSIAAKYLGAGERYPELLAANSALVYDPNILPAGQVLNIP
ncbi:MAG: LysM peptidoglycan-binding domain-containing protein [Clostridia bacterium]|nr:LysM peptidoglycan-binding domain-containing protein [Clostridia bacterium]